MKIDECRIITTGYWHDDKRKKKKREKPSRENCMHESFARSIDDRGRKTAAHASAAAATDGFSCRKISYFFGRRRLLPAKIIRRTTRRHGTISAQWSACVKHDRRPQRNNNYIILSLFACSSPKIVVEQLNLDADVCANTFVLNNCQTTTLIIRSETLYGMKHFKYIFLCYIRMV